MDGSGSATDRVWYRDELTSHLAVQSESSDSQPAYTAEDIHRFLAEPPTKVTIMKSIRFLAAPCR